MRTKPITASRWALAWFPWFLWAAVSGVGAQPPVVDQPAHASASPPAASTVESSAPDETLSETVENTETVDQSVLENTQGTTGMPRLGQSMVGGGAPQDLGDPNDVIFPRYGLGGQSNPDIQMPPPRFNLPLTASFGNGFELKSKDDEYTLQIHDLTQFDGRFYSQPGQENVKDTFVFPRQWFIFSGRLTKPYEYYISIAEGFDTLNILDVFLNIHYDDRLQLKIGRFKTPFTYEFYTLPIQGLINPERSLFFNNFGVNRDLGVMAWGQILKKRVDYAVGIFNGTRNSFIDLNDAKDAMGFVSFKPFDPDRFPALANFSFGGSMDYGSQLNVPIPTTLRTTVATTGNAIVGVPFLQFNPDVREAGERALYSVHSSYYYKSLSVIGEWQSGFQNYARSSNPTAPLVAENLFAQTQLPIDSFYVQGGYFLTGEHVNFRGVVKPLRPFDLRKGKRGPGAWEYALRYNLLWIGEDVFRNNLANRSEWTNQLYSVTTGFNWYWNQFLKVVLEWEHDEFDNPVRYAPGKLQKNSELFMTRLQIFF